MVFGESRHTYLQIVAVWVNLERSNAFLKEEVHLWQLKLTVETATDTAAAQMSGRGSDMVIPPQPHKNKDLCPANPIMEPFQDTPKSFPDLHTPCSVLRNKFPIPPIPFRHIYEQVKPPLLQPFIFIPPITLFFVLSWNVPWWYVPHFADCIQSDNKRILLAMRRWNLVYNDHALYVWLQSILLYFSLCSISSTK